jgi:hypothetical protein
MYRTVVALGLLLAVQAGVCQSKKKVLDDSMLDRVTAAGVTASVDPSGVINFSGVVPTANGLVTGVGTMSIQATPLSGMTLGSLTLGGDAQQNLSSLVNINAVNSNINVLLNLTINVDSTVGSILQSNMTGKH